MPALRRLVRRVVDPGDGARWWQRAPTFVLWGGAWTLLYLGAYAALREPLGAQVANAVTLVLTTIGSTASHRFFTYTVRDRSVRRNLAHQALGLVLLGVGLALTSGSLWLLARARPDASAALEVLVLLVANGLSGAVRFGVLHAVMRPPHHRNRWGGDHGTIGAPWGHEPDRLPR